MDRNINKGVIFLFKIWFFWNEFLKVYYSLRTKHIQLDIVLKNEVSVVNYTWQSTLDGVGGMQKWYALRASGKQDLGGAAKDKELE